MGMGLKNAHQHQGQKWVFIVQCPAKEQTCPVHAPFLCMSMELLNDLPSQPIPDYNMPLLIKGENNKTILRFLCLFVSLDPPHSGQGERV